MIEPSVIKRARTCFLDDHYGCAETVLMVLQEAYDLDNASDSSPAMALNGGVAWSGGICGALSGAAIAVGRLAAKRLADRHSAKRIARQIMAHCMEEFRERHGAMNCRELIRQDIYTEAQHAAFIESGLWRTQCMSQIEFVIRHLYSLRDEQVWQNAIVNLKPSN